MPYPGSKRTKVVKTLLYRVETCCASGEHEGCPPTVRSADSLA